MENTHGRHDHAITYTITKEESSISTSASGKELMAVTPTISLVERWYYEVATYPTPATEYLAGWNKTLEPAALEINPTLYFKAIWMTNRWAKRIGKGKKKKKQKEGTLINPNRQAKRSNPLENLHNGTSPFSLLGILILL